jgi:hypothetical protein
VSDNFLADYEQHLLTAARALAGAPPGTARRRRRLRIGPLATSAAAAAGILAILLAFGWPSPSTEKTGSGETEVQRPPAVAGTAGSLAPSEKTLGIDPASNPQVAGEGTSARGRAWSLATGRQAESFCLSLVVSGANGPYAAAQCGGMTPGSFGVAFNSGDEEGDPVLFYGTAPDAARIVAITVGAAEHRAPVFNDPHGIPGRFYVVEAPGYWREMKTSRMTLLDENDQPLTGIERTRGSSEQAPASTASHNPVARLPSTPRYAALLDVSPHGELWRGAAAQPGSQPTIAPASKQQRADEQRATYRHREVWP